MSNDLNQSVVSKVHEIVEAQKELANVQKELRYWVSQSEPKIVNLYRIAERLFDTFHYQEDKVGDVDELFIEGSRCISAEKVCIESKKAAQALLVDTLEVLDLLSHLIKPQKPMDSQAVKARLEHWLSVLEEELQRLTQLEQKERVAFSHQITTDEQLLDSWHRKTSWHLVSISAWLDLMDARIRDEESPLSDSQKEKVLALRDKYVALGNRFKKTSDALLKEMLAIRCRRVRRVL